MFALSERLEVKCGGDRSLARYKARKGISRTKRTTGRKYLMECRQDVDFMWEVNRREFHCRLGLEVVSSVSDDLGVNNYRVTIGDMYLCK